ncbi:MAG: hypothetical protein ACRECQ_09905, partial [Burkholderiaceae bacterium]
CVSFAYFSSHKQRKVGRANARKLLTFATPRKSKPRQPDDQRFALLKRLPAFAGMTIKDQDQRMNNTTPKAKGPALPGLPPHKKPTLSARDHAGTDSRSPAK